MIRNDEVAQVLAQRDADRARERARLATRPSDNWIVADQYRMQAAAPDAPKPVEEKRRRGRPPKVRA